MPGRSEVTLTHLGHAGAILQGFNQLREDSLLYDCILTLNNSKYHVHKCILAAFSSYFRTLFASQGKWKESNKFEIALNQINDQHFEAILQYIYTGKICLNMDNIAEIWAISDMLQMQLLLEICHDYLVNQISPSNCIGIWKHARIFNDVELEQFACQYIVKSIGEVSCHSEFLEISCDDLHFLLSYFNDDIYIDSKNFEIAMQKLKTFYRDNSLSCRQSKVHSSNDFSLPGSTCLIIAGGYYKGLVGSFEVFCPSSGSWRILSSLRLSQSKHCHWIGLVGVRIYAITGNSAISLNTMESILLPEAEAYLKTKTLETGWEYESIMPQDSSNMSFCVLNDYIYACGIFLPTVIPSDHSGNSPMKVCQYSPSEGTWEVETVTTMTPRVMFQLEPHNGCLLFIGGLNVATEQAMCSFQVYHPENRSLKDLTSMNYPRYNFGTTTSNGYLYAVGGCRENNCLLSSVERYSFETETWCEWIDLPQPRACMACTTMGGALYCVGGESNDEDNAPVVDTLMLEANDDIWTYVDACSPRISPCIIKT